MSPDAEERLQRWFEWLGDGYTLASFDEAMIRWERGEEPPEKESTNG